MSQRLTRGEVEGWYSNEPGPPLASAHAMARALLASWDALEKTQWGALTGFDDPYCTACEAIKQEGHREGCPIAAALPAPEVKP